MTGWAFVLAVAQALLLYVAFRGEKLREGSRRREARRANKK